MRIRNLLGLKDNVFRLPGGGARPRPGAGCSTAGAGATGCGMDQTGAYGMALEGYTFEEILKRYYTGIQLTPLEP